MFKNTVSITYVDPDGEEKTVDAEIGQNLLHVAHDNNVELEGEQKRIQSTCQFSTAKQVCSFSNPAFSFDYTALGACGAELACSTCHLIFEKEMYDKLPGMTEEEEDMLDLAFEVTET